MRSAWPRRPTSEPAALLAAGVEAFDASRREARTARGGLRGCWQAWRGRVEWRRRVGPIARQLAQATERRRQERALRALSRFARASQLLCAAAEARLARRRALALAHAYAWRGDTLHATFFLLWERWRARAAGRVRLRAFLADHMRRSGLRRLELPFKGWRKVVAALASAREAATVAAAAAAAASAGPGLDAAAATEAGAAVVGDDEAASTNRCGDDAAELRAALRFAASLPEPLAGSRPASAQPAAAAAAMQQAAPPPGNGGALSPSSSRSSSLRSDDSISLAHGSGGGGGREEEGAQPGGRHAHARLRVHVSLADSPDALLPTGCPLPPHAAVAAAAAAAAVGAAAPRGLVDAGAAQVARAARDLRELQGRFHAAAAGGTGGNSGSGGANDADGEGSSSSGSAEASVAAAAFRAAQPAPWLRRALAEAPRAELVWRRAFPQDAGLWQRVAGLLREGYALRPMQQQLRRDPGAGGAAAVAQAARGAGSEDRAFAAALIRAEQLLERAAHALLGIGSDVVSGASISGGAADHLVRHLRAASGLPAAALRGDLLLWLLAPLLALDAARAAAARRASEARAAARLGGAELRARALALHRHRPHAFTLDAAPRDGEGEWRARWGAAAAAVEAVSPFFDLAALQCFWQRHSTHSSDVNTTHKPKQHAGARLGRLFVGQR